MFGFGFRFGPGPTLYRIADCDGLFWWFARCDFGLDVLVSRRLRRRFDEWHEKSNLQQDLADTARFGKPLRARGLGKRQSLRNRQPELARLDSLGKAGEAL